MDISISTRAFPTLESYQRWLELRSVGFTPWYTDAEPATEWGRRTENARGLFFPDHLLRFRIDRDDWSATLGSAPLRWDGDPDALAGLDEITPNITLSDRQARWSAHALEAATRLGLDGLLRALTRPIARRRLRDANATVLVAIHLDPKYRGRGVAQQILTLAIERAREQGRDYVLSPFRPSGYGPWKAERGASHSAELFAEYAAERRDDGLPIDPWFRSLTRLGVEFVKLAPQSMRLERPAADFEQLRATFKPDEWYSPQPGVWECGETQTWYERDDLVVSIEPNAWGVLDLRDR